MIHITDFLNDLYYMELERGRLVFEPAWPTPPPRRPSSTACAWGWASPAGSF